MKSRGFNINWDSIYPESQALASKITKENHFEIKMHSDMQTSRYRSLFGNVPSVCW